MHNRNRGGGGIREDSSAVTTLGQWEAVLVVLVNKEAKNNQRRGVTTVSAVLQCTTDLHITQHHNA